MTADLDRRYMARAIEMAGKGLYTAKPNPRVGCIMVKDETVIAEGWHQRTGGPHAEIVALQQAGEAAAGATVYLSLEPCSHYGKTPPCVDALIAAGVKRVVVAMQDPNPLVAGKGLHKLLQAGIDVEHGVDWQAAERLNPGFLKRMRQQLPYVRCKVAMSIDGRTAMASGESQWITGADARIDVQHWRARSSAILTGIGTVLVDNPSLNVRFDDLVNAPYTDPDVKYPVSQDKLNPSDDAQAIDFKDKDQPVRVVLDSRLRISEDAALLQLPGPVLIYTCHNDPQKIASLKARGAEICLQACATPQLNVTQVLADLAKRDVNEVLLEAGARLNGAMLSAGLVDEFIFYIAPSIMGDQARGAFHLPAVTAMAQKQELSPVDTRQIGGDWRIIAQVKKPRQHLLNKE